MLAPGCVVIADNVLCPGAPAYREWLLGDEGRRRFSTQVHKTFIEYSTTTKDEVWVSVLLG